MASGVQSFDVDVYRKISSAIQDVSEGTIDKLPSALDVMKEQATANGLSRDIKHIESLIEGSDQLIKATKQLLELFANYMHLAEMYFQQFDIDYK